MRFLQYWCVVCEMVYMKFVWNSMYTNIMLRTYLTEPWWSQPFWAEKQGLARSSSWPGRNPAGSCVQLFILLLNILENNIWFLVTLLTKACKTNRPELTKLEASKQRELLKLLRNKFNLFKNGWNQTFFGC